MGIRNKLLFNIIVVILCLGAVGGTGLYYTHNVAELSEALVEDEAIPSLKVQELQELALKLWLSYVVHSSVSDAKTMQQMEDKIALLKKKTAEKIKEIEQIHQRLREHDDHGSRGQKGLEKEAGYWEAFRKNWRDFEAHSKQTMSFSGDYFKDEAEQLILRGPGRTTYDKAGTALSEIVKIHHTHLTRLREATTIARQDARAIIIFFAGAVILVAIFSIKHFSHALLEPLLLVNKHLKALAKGQPRQETLEHRAKDEIGEIVRAAEQLKNAMRTTISQANAIAAGEYGKEIKLLSEQDQLGLALSGMTSTLRESIRQSVAQDWVKTGHARLNEQMRGELDLITLGENILNFLTPYTKAQIGVFYLRSGDDRLKMLASHAYARRKRLANEFALGEGLAGQAARERKTILVTQVPEEYFIQSGIGEAAPRNVLVAPFLYEGALKGVLELASFHEFTELQIEFLKQAADSIGIAVNTAESRIGMQTLLEQTQTQAKELQSQTEELQSQSEELQTQQEELRQTNEELEERTKDLEQQKVNVQEKNQALEKTRLAIQTKAEELELASKYKSEFLANMSHELRTPLNSLLILAQLLSDNSGGNLTKKQVEHAKTIHSAGSDLLVLINEILDLSKVEAGKVEIHSEEVLLHKLAENFEQKFRHVAEQKGLHFSSTCADGLPDMLHTDSHRLIQIINNLLSNAFKFTHTGEVSVAIQRPSPDADLSGLQLKSANIVAIGVSDSGIGIPKSKQQAVFKAFQQADGTTSRQYGGTGLGLSISRQLARLLGGDLQLHSEEGKGSTFTLYLPETFKIDTQRAELKESRKEEAKQLWKEEMKTIPDKGFEEPRQEEMIKGAGVKDDRDDLKAGDKFILVIEDDRKFSHILIELAHEKEYKCLLAEDGETGLRLAEEYKPGAIVLDVGLPLADGWTGMEKLKDNPETRHIPVHFMSASDESMDAKKMGAIGYLLKPVSMGELGEAFKKIEYFTSGNLRKLLVLADKKPREQEILELAGGQDISIHAADSVEQAWRQLHEQMFDCIIVDGEAKDGFKLIEQLPQEEKLLQIPVILYGDRNLSETEERMLQQYAHSLTVKSVRSPERLVDEATLFLHQLEADLPREKRNMLRMAHDKEGILKNKKILVADDDVRNVYALTSVLENKGMEVFIAKNGKKALEMLEKHTDIALVIMDIMMPEMDGYETMRTIRAKQGLHNLPIIALTAKAMKGDKAKCIEAGANDYLAKPVDTDKLTSLMRVWLYR
ncbi:MAG: response regulator [Gammaproteobacteria bacterium]|nr:response regulator [Gammaproteobacteria bacterium]